MLRTDQVRKAVAHAPAFRTSVAAWNASLLGILVAVAAVLSFAAMADAQGVTCGPRDGRGRVFKDRLQLGNGCVYNIYCVNGLYFEGEICCGTTCTPFGKCVFDGGLNTDHLVPGNGGQIDKVISYNWCPACGVTLADTDKRRGESEMDWANRVKQLLISRGCDFNCYTWCRAAPFQPGDAIDQVLNVYRAGEEIGEFEIPGERAMRAYAGGNPFLIEEDEMYDLNLVGQTRSIGSLPTFVDDFEDGVLDTRITPLAEEFKLDVANGSLNFNIAAHGDGFRIDTADLHPMCLVLDEMNMAPFDAGAGLGILLEFSTGDWTDVQMYEMSSAAVCQITVKVTQSAGGVTNELRRKVPGVKLNDVKSVQIDWVPNPGQIDRVEIEIMTRDGKMVRQTVRSGLSHTAGATTAYVIRGLDIQYDPAISIGAIHYSDVHTDLVPGVSYNLAVDEVVVDAPGTIRMGEMGTIGLSTIGVWEEAGLILGIPLRELDVSQSEDAAGLVAFTNEAVFCAVDASAISILTDFEGNASATFTAVETGGVEFLIAQPGSDKVIKVPVYVTCRADWNLDRVVDSMDFFMYVEGFIEGRGDVNGDGFTQSDDFFDFIVMFMTPTPC